MLGVGLATVVAGCGTPAQDSGSAPTTHDHDHDQPPTGSAGPFRPDPAGVLTHGPAGTRNIALTVDDGFCDDCVKGYVDFVQRTGIHLTFSPNGTYGHVWGKYADTLKPLVE